MPKRVDRKWNKLRFKLLLYLQIVIFFSISKLIY